MKYFFLNEFNHVLVIVWTQFKISRIIRLLVSCQVSSVAKFGRWYIHWLGRVTFNRHQLVQGCHSMHFRLLGLKFSQRFWFLMYRYQTSFLCCSMQNLFSLLDFLILHYFNLCSDDGCLFISFYFLVLLGVLCNIRWWSVVNEYNAFLLDNRTFIVSISKFAKISKRSRNIVTKLPFSGLENWSMSRITGASFRKLSCIGLSVCLGCSCKLDFFNVNKELLVLWSWKNIFAFPSQVITTSTMRFRKVDTIFELEDISFLACRDQITNSFICFQNVLLNLFWCDFILDDSHDEIFLLVNHVYLVLSDTNSVE